jgi:hypothetical protein
MTKAYNYLSPAGYYGVEAFDYETDMWRLVAEFATKEEAIALVDACDGRLIDACLKIDRCFTLGDYRVFDYTGTVVWAV